MTSSAWTSSWCLKFSWPIGLSSLTRLGSSVGNINSLSYHGRLAKWRKWRACDVEEVKKGLKNDLWRRWSNGWVGELAVTWVKRRKGWRMSCDVGEVTERLENELCSFTNLFVTLPTSQLILQPFCGFIYD